MYEWMDGDGLVIQFVGWAVDWLAGWLVCYLAAWLLCVALAKAIAETHQRFGAPRASHIAGTAGEERADVSVEEAENRGR